MTMPTATAPSIPELARSRRASRAAAAALPPDLDEVVESPGAEEAAEADAFQRAQPASGAETIEAYADMMVEDEDVNITIPLIVGGMVVYLGADRRHSRSLRGIISVESLEIEPEVEDPRTGKILHQAVIQQMKTPLPSGPGSNLNIYDFSTHNKNGRLIKSRMLPAFQTITLAGGVVQRVPTPEELRGKPFAICEHPEHLRFFQRARSESRDRAKLYRVLVPNKYRPAFLQYMADMDRKMGRDRADEEYTVTGRR